MLGPTGPYSSRTDGILKRKYIRQKLQIIENYENTWKPGMIFVADFEKAFNIVFLDFFNIGEYIIKWVKVMWNNPLCKIINNGYFSEIGDKIINVCQ